MSDIEKRLTAALKAAKLLPKEGKNRQKYLEALANAANDEMEEKAWDAVPEDVQQWVVAAVNDIEKGREIREPDAEAKPAKDKSEKDTDDKPEKKADKKADEDDDKPTKKGKEEKRADKAAKKAAAKTDKAAAKKAAKAEREANGTGRGNIDKIFNYLLDNPGADEEEVAKALKKDGVKLGEHSIHFRVGWFYRVAKALEQRGMLKKSITKAAD